MQNGNIGVCFQRSQGQCGLYSSMLLASWRVGFMRYVKTLIFVVCYTVKNIKTAAAAAWNSVSPWKDFFPLCCWFDPLWRTWQWRESESVHLDLVRGVVKTGLLGAGLSQHTILLFFFTPSKAPSMLPFTAQMLSCVAVCHEKINHIY